jgi:hypothetical protein
VLALGFVNETGCAEIIAPETFVQILRPHTRTLQLVFLNGCTTVELSKQLHGIGIAHVIGWSSVVVDEAAQIFSSEFFGSLKPACANVAEAFDSARLAVTTMMEDGQDDFGVAAVVQKYDLEDPLDRSMVQLAFPHRSKKTGSAHLLSAHHITSSHVVLPNFHAGRIAAGRPLHLSHDSAHIHDWLLLARSMQQQSAELVTFKEPVDQQDLHICEHCAPLRAVEGKEYKKLMTLMTDMDSLQDLEMQKRRFNIGALRDDTIDDTLDEQFDADDALMALDVDLAAVLGPAACGKTTTMHKLAYRRLQKALKNPVEPVPVLVHVYRLTAMLKHLEDTHELRVKTRSEKGRQTPSGANGAGGATSDDIAQADGHRTATGAAAGAASRDAAKECVVQLALYDRDRHEIFSAGSGSIVSDTGHILTAAHVVMDYASKSVFFGRTHCTILVAVFVADDQPTRYCYTARIVSAPALLQKMVTKTSLLDIAVLQITGTITTSPPTFSGIGIHAPGFIAKENTVPVAGLACLAFSSLPTSARTGDAVKLYGYPVGPNCNTTDMRLTIAKTIVNSKTNADNAYVRVDATNVAATACSGGPLLNERGVIVAIMSKDFVQGFLKGQGGVNLSHCRMLSMLEPGHGMPDSLLENTMAHTGAMVVQSGSGGSSSGGGSISGSGGDGFDIDDCDMLELFVADTLYGLGISRSTRPNEFAAYQRLLRGDWQRGDRNTGGTVCCIFDGMDEGGRYKAHIEKYVARIAGMPHMRVIVSSRETGFDHTHFRGALGTLYQILPLTGPMKREVIHKRLVMAQPPRCTEKQVGVVSVIAEGTTRKPNSNSSTSHDSEGWGCY